MIAALGDQVKSRECCSDSNGPSVAPVERGRGGPEKPGIPLMCSQGMSSPSVNSAPGSR